jgi:hypothetical protein
MFVAVRDHRREKMPEEVIRTEDQEEFNEGTATYIQARLHQLLRRDGGCQSVLIEEDSLYNGFRNAGNRYREYIESILPADSFRVTFFHSKYRTGMGICLLLDRLQAYWKQELSERGASQFHILKRHFPVRQNRRAKIFRQACLRFGYDNILQTQSRLAEKRISLLRDYLEKPGRRFRLYRGDLRGSFRWKPRGPVYNVPSSLLKQVEEKLNSSGRCTREISYGGSATIWAGGISLLEWGSACFESEEVPVVFSGNCIEWIDPKPDKDHNDIVIRSSRQEDKIYHDLELITDGFRLTLPAARIEKGDSLFAVFPVNPE